jgi:glutathione S-transferase
MVRPAMRVLYHLPLSATSRIVRFLLAEKGLPFDARLEKVWEKRPEFLAISPGGEVPAVVEPDGLALSELWAIVEHLEEKHPETPLLGLTAATRAETRRLVAWFDIRFGHEVGDNLAGEKVMRRYRGGGHPRSEALRAGRAALRHHLDYVAHLAETRRWLAGNAFGLADIAAAAHLSVIDYLGDVPWEQFPEARLWYARLKSRPSFRPFLEDHVPGIPPAAHYRDLDF